MSQNRVDSASYETIKEAIDFSRTKKEFRLKEFDFELEDIEVEEKMDNNFSSLGPKYQFLSYILIIFLIGTIIYIIFSNIKIEKKIEYKDTLENEEDLENIDTFSAYDLAVQNKDFRAAIRMRYLRLLQIFQEKAWIVWRANKTNRDYIREIKVAGEKKNFRSLSFIYEMVWYGNRPINEEEFHYYDEQFKNYIKV